MVTLLKIDDTKINEGRFYKCEWTLILFTTLGKVDNVRRLQNFTLHYAVDESSTNEFSTSLEASVFLFKL